MDSIHRKYRDLIPLARGGMGDVTLAVLQGPSGFNKLQVIKRLRLEIADNPDFVAMFLDEARIGARLSHPNIVQTNEVGQEEDVLFMAMEYLEGQSLYTLLKRAKHKGDSLDPRVTSGHLSQPTPLSASVARFKSVPAPLRMSPLPSTPINGIEGGAVPLAIALRIVCDALEGLHYAHELKTLEGVPLNIVHRDFSPGNVFVLYDGSVKVLDFGIAKAADAQVHTRAGMIKGKVPYMAPEQFRGGSIDRRCDLYAVGAVLWEIAAGTRLWQGFSDLEIVTQLTRGGAKSPRAVNPSVHPMLEAICMRALAIDRSRRYTTAAELQADLEQLLREMGDVTNRDVGQYVSSVFAQKRAEQRAIIEAKLREIRRKQEGGAPAPVPSGPALPTAASSGALARVVVTTHAGIASPEPKPLPESRSRAPIFASTAAAVFFSLGAAIYYVSRPPPPPSESTPPASAAAVNAALQTSSAPPEAPGPRTRLLVQATPADARLYLDDKPLMVNPFNGELPQDGATHRIRGEADGFISETRSVTLSGRMVTLQMRLARAPSRADGG